MPPGRKKRIRQYMEKHGVSYAQALKVMESTPRPQPENNTSGGAELTNHLIEQLAAEAEEGYPTEQLRSRRPIPSQTALNYDHLMADADRAALIAEVDRLDGRLVAVLDIHRPETAVSRSTGKTYQYCVECSDDSGDGSRGHFMWPCDTAKAALGS
jgi:hypothetical protein